MELPAGYTFAIGEEQLKSYWPNLKVNSNFDFTSLRTDIATPLTPKNYNCVAWAIGVNDKWMDMPNYFQDYFDLDPDTVDHSVDGYADVLTRYGFERCDDSNIENGFEKIAIYGDGERVFTHVCRQLANGKWTSKMGEWEDIEHSSLEALSGADYGTPQVFMRRKQSEQ